MTSSTKDSVKPLQHDQATFQPVEAAPTFTAGDGSEELHIRPAEIGRIFNYIDLFMIRLDAKGMVTLWTSAAEKILKIEAGETVGKPLTECNVPWDSVRMEEGFHRCMDKGCSLRYEDVSVELENGDNRYLSVTFIPLPGEGDELCGVACLGYDRTERTILEIFLAEDHKLKAVGQIVASMNQEITAPIQYMGDNIRFLNNSFNELIGIVEANKKLFSAIKARSVERHHIDDVEKAFEKADWEYISEEIPNAIIQVENGLDRVSNAVQTINNFSQVGMEDWAEIDLNRAVESAVVMTRNETKFIAKVVTELEPDLPAVACHQGQIQQVLMHLIHNACDAISAKIEAKKLDTGTVKIITRPEKDKVEIWVCDDGIGIPEEIQSKIFDPFFTTKAQKKGAGHGLAFCRTVVEERHAGLLRFETVSDNGTIFIIELPCADSRNE